MPYRMLHKGIGCDDEISGEPGSQKEHYGRYEMSPRAETLLAEEEQAEKRRLGKECEHTLHGEREADNAASIIGEARPVGAELKLHRNSGYNAYRKVDAEDASPETCGD